MARRQHLVLTLLSGLFVFFTLSYLFSAPAAQVDDVLPLADHATLKQDGGDAAFELDLDALPVGILEGGSIAPKLENATLKAELGRATWKFLHTMAARFPDKPTPEERGTLETFIHLFGRLYPCGECAKHFRELLAEYPPQTSSRSAAAGWLCFAHNIVNDRLGKPDFDCNNIGDFYDCGCGDEGAKKEGDAGDDDTEASQELRDTTDT